MDAKPTAKQVTSFVLFAAAAGTLFTVALNQQRQQQQQPQREKHQRSSKSNDGGDRKHDPDRAAQLARTHGLKLESELELGQERELPAAGALSRLLQWLGGPSQGQTLHGEKKTLNVFDFDGTLFRSPMPNAELWDRAMLGLLLAEPKRAMLQERHAGSNNDNDNDNDRNSDSAASSSGLAWFQDPLTLSAPFVPAVGDPRFQLWEWFVQPVVERAMQSMRDPNCVTVLLTGRNVLYEGLVRELVGRAGLEFDAFGLKPVHDGIGSTLSFKINWIDDYARRCGASNVALWEDRESHAEQFALLRPSWTIHKVREEKSLLPHDLERRLVGDLKDRYLPDRKFREHPPRHVIQLDGRSKQVLRDVLSPPGEWRRLGDLDCPEQEPSTVGGELRGTVTAVGKFLNRLCVRISFGGVAVDSVFACTKSASRKLEEPEPEDSSAWVTIENPIDICGSSKVLTLVGLEPTDREQMIEERRRRQQARQSSAISVPKDKRLALGAVVKKLRPDLAGREIGDEVQRVKAWLVESSIPESTDHQVQIEAFIAGRRPMSDTQPSNSAPVKRSASAHSEVPVGALDIHAIALAERQSHILSQLTVLQQRSDQL